MQTHVCRPNWSRVTVAVAIFLAVNLLLVTVVHAAPTCSAVFSRIEVVDNSELSQVIKETSEAPIILVNKTIVSGRLKGTKQMRQTIGSENGSSGEIRLSFSSKVKSKGPRQHATMWNPREYDYKLEYRTIKDNKTEEITLTFDRTYHSPRRNRYKAVVQLADGTPGELVALIHGGGPIASGARVYLRPLKSELKIEKTERSELTDNALPSDFILSKDNLDQVVQRMSGADEIALKVRVNNNISKYNQLLDVLKQNDVISLAPGFNSYLREYPFRWRAGAYLLNRSNYENINNKGRGIVSFRATKIQMLNLKDYLATMDEVQVSPIHSADSQTGIISSRRNFQTEILHSKVAESWNKISDDQNIEMYISFRTSKDDFKSLVKNVTNLSELKVEKTYFNDAQAIGYLTVRGKKQEIEDLAQTNIRVETVGADGNIKLIN